MYLQKPICEPSELGPNSETFLIWEEDGFPQTGCVALHQTGRCDDRALDAALFQAMDHEPLFFSHIVPERKTLFWLQPEPEGGLFCDAAGTCLKPPEITPKA
ncbi:hypothetical protein [Desulfatirhabdium butyrativorans]|uniref:hypothetical protein n=1 Tax=Desulfatirhabdium butyrativorans TaxID=340467 RepID=UPI000488E923|nr:hypothetical protein [Desulfatirhabdium butyrativorans]